MVDICRSGLAESYQQLKHKKLELSHLIVRDEMLSENIFACSSRGELGAKKEKLVWPAFLKVEPVLNFQGWLPTPTHPCPSLPLYNGQN